MITLAQDSNLLPVQIENNRGLSNPFSSKVASPQQTHDMLNFGKIGTDDFLQYI